MQGGWVGAWCVYTRCSACVGLLCGAGAGQADGWTPIMFASLLGGHVAVVAALVSRGANVSARTVRSCYCYVFIPFALLTRVCGIIGMGLC
jgi:hypothetical protein